MIEQLPDHLGGHLNKTHVDTGALYFFKNELNCLSMLDIGCGPGGQCEAAWALGFNPVLGLDGDFTLNRDNLEAQYKLIDFTKEKYKDSRKYDLGWSCEVVEHVEEQYIPNFMPAFQSCKFVAMTYCPPQPDKLNPHHFNEQPEEYWLKVFNEYGFKYEKELTQYARASSTMRKPFFANRGLVFRNIYF